MVESRGAAQQQLTIDLADIGIGAHRSNRDLLAGGLRRQRVERLHLGAAIDAVRTKPHRDAARDRVDGIALEGRARGEAHAVERSTVRSVGQPADHAIVDEEMRAARTADKCLLHVWLEYVEADKLNPPGAPHPTHPVPATPTK